MFCKKCGKELLPDAVFCPSCGTRAEERSAFEPYGQGFEYNAAQQQYQYQSGGNQPYEVQRDISSAQTFGIVAIIAGALGLCLIGWIFAGLGLSKANRYMLSINPQIQYEAHKAKKLNVIGLVVSSIIFFIMLVACIVMFISALGIMGFYF